MKKLILTILTLFSFLTCFAQFSDSSELIIKMRRDYDHVIFADVDQDGDDDIVAGFRNEIYILENDGAGNFSPAALLLEVSDHLNVFAFEDVDSDGLLDLIVLHYSYSVPISKVEIWSNSGNLNYNLETSFSAPTGAESNSFAYVDLDNDGIKELVTAGRINSNSKIFKQTTGFNFTPIATLSISRGIVVGDVNNDGWPDILGGFGHQFKVAMNDGTGNFPTLSGGYTAYTSNNQPELQLVDYNGDGNLDVALIIYGSGTLYLFSNDGTGVFSLDQSINITDSNVSGLTLHDLNSDGIMDLVWKTNVTMTIYAPGKVKALFGNGTGFGTVQTINNKISGRPYISFSDNIGNGVDNLLVFGGKEDLRRFLLSASTAPGVYDNDTYLETIHFKYNVNMMTADFNGNGFIDLAVPPLFYYNQGNGTFIPDFDSTLLVAGSYNCKIKNHGDFNNDGIEDLVGDRKLPNGHDQIVYFLGLPGGGYGTYNTIPSEFVKNINVQDINGDGFLDIYYTYHSSSNYPKVFFAINNGGNGFSHFEFMGNWNFNNLSDYHPFINYTIPKKDTISNNINLAYIINDEITVKLNDGSAPQEIGVTASKMKLNDMDGDGYTDIFYVRYTDGIGWVKNQGNGTFVDQGIIHPIDYIINPILKDLDNDNDLDIVYQEYNSNTIYWLEAIGYGNYAPPVVLATDSKLSQANGVTYQYAEDFDNDGDVDIAYMKDTPFGSVQQAGDLFLINNLLVGTNEVSGFTFNDLNQNKLWDSNESPLPNLPVYLSTVATDYSGQNGDFSFSPIDDNYLVEFPTPQYWSLTTDSINYTVSVSPQTSIFDSLYFGLSADTLMYNSEIEAIGGFPRCNSEANLWLSVHNTGTLPASGILEVILDDSISFINSFIPPDSIVGESYFWSYDSLAVFDFTNINLTTLLPDFQSMGDTLTTIVINHITDSAGTIISTTSDTLRQILVCGYDPNDKAVEPAGLTQEGFIPVSESTLEFLVRFQNTGNDTVFKTKIVDQIHPNLDISTLEILGFSHPMTTKISPTKRLIFEFDDILLPDSSVNFLGSQGYVKFKIDLMPGLTPGDKILNKADIFFDLNPPVITNMTTNTIFSCDSLIKNISGSSSGICIEDIISFEAELKHSERINWYLNGNLISDSTSVAFLGTSTNDTLKLVSSNAFCVQDSTWIVQIDTIVNPDLMLPNHIDVCEGENPILQSNYTTGNNWFFNGLSAGNYTTLNANSTGEYILFVENGACSNADTVYIDFHPIPTPSITSSNMNIDTIDLCQGESLQLNSNYQFGNSWFFNGTEISTDSLITVDQTGTYSLHVTNGYCTNFGADSVQINVHTLPVPQVDIVNDETMFSVQTHAQYFWLDCNNSMNFMPSQFGQTFTPDSAGNYALQVYDEFGCTDTTDCFEIGYLSIKNYSNQNISIIPNPATDKIYIKGLKNSTEVTLTDATGKEVLKVKTSNSIDITGISEGAYFLSFTFENQHIVKKVIIK